MALHKDWNNIKAASGNRPLKPGAYVARIVSAQNFERGEYIELLFDIAEGEEKGRYASMSSDKDWMHTHRVYHKDTCESIFKGFLDAIESSNTGFSIEAWQNMDETRMMNTLIGKVYGFTFNDCYQLKLWWKEGDNGKREFVGQTLPDYFTVDDVRSGKFKLPEVQWRIQEVQGGQWKNVEQSEYEAAKLLTDGHGTVASDDESIPF